ncbi:MAG: hypothetical protein ACOX8S_05000 [Christensenellales bacterium]|jgi:hypothetical protein
MTKYLRKLLAGCLLALAAISVAACSSMPVSQATPTKQSLNLQAARPLLNSAAEALAYDVRLGFSEQPDEYFFSHHISALLRSSVLADSNSPFTSDLSDNYTIKKEDLISIYGDLYALGEYPGIYSLEGEVWEKDGVITFKTPQKGALSSEMSFAIKSINEKESGDILLHADLISTLSSTGAQNDIGDYEITVRIDSGAPFGCRLISLVPKSIASDSAQPTPSPSASPEKTTAEATETPPEPRPSDPPQEEYFAMEDLDEYFGYSAEEALDDLEPMISAAALTCLHMEYNIAGAPNAETVWRLLWVLAGQQGSRLNGATLTDEGVFMLNDDILILYLDIFADPGDGLPDLPEGYETMVKQGENGFTFLEPESLDQAEIREYAIDGENLIFVVAVTGDISANLLVTIIPSELSNYGFAVSSVSIR